jgi:hypothetical protein
VAYCRKKRRSPAANRRIAKIVAATGWSWAEAEACPKEAFEALCQYWYEDTPPVNVLIGAIARTLGVRFGKGELPQHVTQPEQLFHHMKVNPEHLPKWEPKHKVITFGNS